ncbi:hypothetical protein JB92DRAFT_2181325 [Gautieria morchelliformis]|nr:hypothetical protein JB92DRAFT_2181325 [Gautieria morchelliformis]
MLIAETLGDTGRGKARGGAGATVQNGERYAYGGQPEAGAAPGTGATTGAWYAETEGVGVGGGMGVIDVGSEGDKRKRLNRQSANYGSKAVACVHCRARKTRCDAARPACGNCARRSLVCSYIHTQPSQPRSKGKKAAAAAAKEEAARNAANKASAEGDGTTSLSASLSPTRRHSPASGSQHSGAAHEEWQQAHAHPQHAAHALTLAHTHTLQTPPAHARAHPHIPPGSPIRVDDRLIEESAERDRPLTRSPAGPPIATLPAGSPSTSPASTSHRSKHDAPYTNGGANGKAAYVNGAGHADVRKALRTPDGAGLEAATPVGDMRSRSNSAGPGEGADGHGAKRKTAGSDEDVERDLLRESERPGKKRKWQEEEENVSGDDTRMRV